MLVYITLVYIYNIGIYNNIHQNLSNALWIYLACMT